MSEPRSITSRTDPIVAAILVGEVHVPGAWATIIFIAEVAAVARAATVATGTKRNWGLVMARSGTSQVPSNDGNPQGKAKRN